jgi:hypothetical protein
MSQPVEPNPNTISRIHTACKECVFASYNDKTQVGCEMDLLDKYKSKDTTIIEAYDEDKEFYILNNRKCIGFRKNSWFNKFGDNLTLQDKKEKVLDSFKLRYMLLVDLKRFTTDSLEKLFDDLSKMDIKPSKIILVRYNYANKIFDYDYIKEILEKSNLGCAWRLQTMLDESVGIKSVLSHTVSNNQNYKYMLYLTDYTDKANDIVNKANNLIFKDLESFTVISDESYIGYMFLGLMYRYIWFTSKIDLLEEKNTFTIV